MLNKLFYITFFVFLNASFYIYFDKLKKKINLYDYPSNIKVHKSKILLGGGFLLLFNIIFIFFFFIFNFKKIDISIFYTTKSYISFFLIIFFAFFLGYLDDKKNLSANVRLTILSFVILFAILLDTDLLIKELKFSGLNNTIYLQEFSIVFTILSFLLFMSAFNMFDGINLQAGVYALILLIILLINKVNFYAIAPCIIFLLLFIFLNYLNKIYLGETGVLILSYIISYFFIKSYNLAETFYADQIFLFMLFPGLDLIRLFIIRILKLKNPFKGDNNHIHHYLLRNFSTFRTFLIILISYFIPILFFLILNNSYISVFLTIIIYSFLIYRYSKN